jgi:acetolactate synthase-1/2/3 large subunit
VEVPANYYMLTQNIPELAYDGGPAAPTPPDPAQVAAAAKLLTEAKHPALYVGYGARGASERLQQVAEKLAAPVTTTIQGKGVMPESHPLWLWNGFGRSAPPFVRSVMDRCDALLAIGCRFGEVATASYGFETPENLIHVDIDLGVFDRNYQSVLSVESDAGLFLAALLEHLEGTGRDRTALEAEIAKGHAALAADRAAQKSGERVRPAALFTALQKHAGGDAIYTADSGNSTFLAMEHLRLEAPGRFLAPVDYSCMGYSVPAALGAKIANPNKDVIALAGDGALLMTGLELLTGAAYGAAPAVFVLRDGELAQIAQFQKITMNKKTDTELPGYSVEAFAAAANCDFLALTSDADCDAVVAEALKRTRAGGPPLMVDVAIDYSYKTFFTKGAVTTNFWRLPWNDRLKLLGRAVGRRIVPS